MGEPRHPDVLQAIEAVIASGKRRGVPVGLAFGDDPRDLVHWAKKGVAWLLVGADFTLLLKAAAHVAGQVREEFGPNVR
jgi:2-keto-3-deoxy-L-rhamnonate aldolase RhmA